MHNEFFSRSYFFGFVNDIIKTRTHQSKAGMDGFKLAFLLVICSDRFTLCIIKQRNIERTLDMPPFKLAF